MMISLKVKNCDSQAVSLSVWLDRTWAYSIRKDTKSLGRYEGFPNLAFWTTPEGQNLQYLAVSILSENGFKVVDQNPYTGQRLVLVLF